MSGLTVLAPAKLNLFLHILGRRADGYHELQTVFQLLDFADEVRLSVRADGRIVRRGGVASIAAEDDLTVRAASLLKRVAATSLGADIALVKRIPMGAGLGGGSADAAAVLTGLNALWGLDLGTQALAELGLALGADVPVFVAGKSAFASGVGEQLSPVSIVSAWYLVLVPPCHVATGEIFAAPALTRDTKPLKIADFLGDGQTDRPSPVDSSALFAATRNDCEATVCERYAPVRAALRWLREYGEARMTGTGSSVFAHFKSESEARRVLAHVPDDWRAFVARGVDDVASLRAEIARA